MEKQNFTTTGISALELLCIVFIVLKLCSVITWSWWWVLAPIWIPLGIALIVCIIVLIVSLFK